MNRRSLFWGLLFLVLAVFLATTADGSAPRIGMAVMAGMFGLTLILMANAAWFLRRTTNPEDYKGTCPVGESCSGCGAFNYKPRKTCRSCGHTVNASEGS